MMKKTLLISFILCSLSFSAFASRTKMREKTKSMTTEEKQQFHEARKAKRQARYDSASDEKKIKMDARKAKRQAKRAARKASRGN